MSVGVDARPLPNVLAASLHGAGIAFTATWCVALVLFPLYKELPIGYVPIVVGMAAGIAVGARSGRLTSWLLAASDRRFLMAIAALAVGLRLVACVYYPLMPANDHEMFYRLAASMVAGDGYAIEGRPTAFFPPGMSLLLAATFRIFGPGPWVAKTVGLLTGVLLVIAGYLFAIRATSRPIARWTALVLATSPTLIAYSATVGYEPLLGALVLAWAWLTDDLIGRRGLGGWRLAVLGVISGVGTLIQPICLLLPGLSLVVWLVRRDGTAALWRAAAAAVLMMSIVSPWTLRNWRALGHPVLVSTNGGVVLYSANNPVSRGIAERMKPLPGEVDEVSRDRLRREAAVRWILANPLDWARLAVAKVSYGWGTSSTIMSYVSADRMPPREEDVSKGLLNVGWGALFVWCAAGTLRTRIWSRATLLPAILFLGYLTAVHLFYEALSRHHITVLPILAIVAAAWLSRSEPVAAAPDPSGRQQ